MRYTHSILPGLVFACLSCHHLPERGAPCAVSHVEAALPQDKQAELRKALSRALAARFRLCKEEALRAGYLCKATLSVEKRGRYEPVLSEESQRERASLIKAVARAEAALRAAVETGESIDIDLKRAAVEKAKLELGKFKPEVVSWKEKVLFRLDVQLIGVSDGKIAWERTFYACGAGAPCDTAQAVHEAAGEALEELSRQVREALAGESVRDRIKAARDRFNRREM